jgi:hypothetical protein
MKKLIIALVLLSAAGRLLAADDTPQTRLVQADRYLAATPPTELFAEMAENIAKNVPPEKRQALKDMLTKNLDIAALTKAMRDALVKDFTTEELKALADFYGSPVGKGAMKKFGIYMADVMPSIQSEVMKAMDRAKKPAPAAPQ